MLSTGVYRLPRISQYGGLNFSTTIMFHWQTKVLKSCFFISRTLVLLKSLVVGPDLHLILSSWASHSTWELNGAKTFRLIHLQLDLILFYWTTGCKFNSNGIACTGQGVQ